MVTGGGDNDGGGGVAPRSPVESIFAIRTDVPTRFYRISGSSLSLAVKSSA